MKKLAIALISIFCFAGSAMAEKPLLIEGKQNLFQRVLSTPECILKKSEQDQGKKIPSFSRFYVYERTDSLLKVGPDTSGTNLGYLDTKCTVNWDIQTSLMFTQRSKRDRALIFKDQTSLMKIIDAADPASIVDPMLAKATKNEGVESVLSIEPEKPVDATKEFYLIPILEFEETMFEDGNDALALKIASISEKEQQKVQSDNGESALKAFKAAVVFVIDSTISMQSYLDRTKNAISKIYKKIEADDLGDSVNFGLIAFRANASKTKGNIDYITKVFVNPGEVKTEKDFADKLADLKEAAVSTDYFEEDAYAGIDQALNSVDWSKYGARYVVLITDAGAIEATKDKRISNTTMSSSQLRLFAKNKGVAIYVLHLLTPEGQAHHAKAKSQYEDLSYNDILNKSLYYPIKGGSVDSFGKMTDLLADSVTDQIKGALDGKETAGAVTAETDTQSIDSMENDTRLLGHAMQMSYLGSVEGQTAPSFFEGWISDRDLKMHNFASCEPVVLLTKSQLSDLKTITKSILDKAQESVLDPSQMFEGLRDIAAKMGRDPSTLKEKSIAQMGLVDEYLEGLPYKSQIQGLTEDIWTAMGPDEQDRLIQNLENKLALYQKYNDNTDSWVKLNEEADASEDVFPVPLEALP